MKIRICLSALTRLEYTKVVEVPDDVDENELDEMVRQEYDTTDGGEFTDDPHYWEKGDCYWEKVRD